MGFDHEKLDVYRTSLAFAARANALAGDLPRGRGYLADQLQRAALSIMLNVAEGAGRFAPDDKAAFYTRARASATECAAILDACRHFGLIEEDAIGDSKATLERIGKMLTKLVQSQSRRHG